MTVSYNLDISSVSTFSFCKLLFHWKGSIWKSVYGELSIWIISFYSILYVNKFHFNHSQRERFSLFSQHCDRQLEYIPLTFMLGFFVTIIVTRWRRVFTNMGWIENCALTLAALIPGDDATTVLQRRSVVRYLVLTQILVFRDISMRVRRRFPNMESLLRAGFIQDHELVELDNVVCEYNKYWVPIEWSMSICTKAHREGKVAGPPLLKDLIMEIREFRAQMAMLCNFDWVPIPIAYPQVVFFAVRAYFGICLVSRQYVNMNPPENESYIVQYVPFMTILQFIFVLGWMKVAEALLNPLGEDDDDFECNFLIDKNITTGMAIVDQCAGSCPDLKPDKFMDKDYTPIYSEESTKTGLNTPLVGSVQEVTLADSTETVNMIPVKKFASKLDGLRKPSATQRFRRTFSNAIRSNRRFSDKPKLDLGVSLPPNFSLVSVQYGHQRPKSISSLANENGGFDTLSDLGEEEHSSDRSWKLQMTRETDEEEDDEDVHEVIRNEVHPPDSQR